MSIDSRTCIDLPIVRKVSGRTLLELVLMKIDPIGRIGYMWTGDAVVIASRRQLQAVVRKPTMDKLSLKEWFGLRETRYEIGNSGDIRKADLGGRTLLHRAAAKGLAEATRLLIAKGLDVNARREGRVRPIHLAAKAGGAGALKALLEAGAEVNATDMFSRTALHLAAMEGRIECVKILLAKGADLTATDRRKRTPLDYVEKTNKPLRELLTSRPRTP